MKPAGLLRVAALALIWGSGFLLIKISLRGFTPVQLTFARLALGAVVLVLILAVMRLKLPGERRLWVHLVVAALLANAIPYTLFGVAEQTVDSNLAGAINATTPLWTVLFALLARRHDPLGPVQWVGMVLGFAGALLILSPWQANSAPLPGVLACLGASASYGLSYVYMGRYLTNRGLPPLVLSAGQLIAASGLLVLATPFGGLAAPTLATRRDRRPCPAWRHRNRDRLRDQLPNHHRRRTRPRLDRHLPTARRRRHPRRPGPRRADHPATRRWSRRRPRRSRLNPAHVPRSGNRQA